VAFCRRARAVSPAFALIIVHGLRHRPQTWALNTLSGWAVSISRLFGARPRLRNKSPTIIAFGTVTFLLGAGLLLGLSLLLTQAGMSGSVLNVHASIAMLAGGLLLAAVIAYLWLGMHAGTKPLRYRRLVIPVPRPRIAFAQVGRGMRGFVVRGERSLCACSRSRRRSASERSPASI